MIQSTTTKMVRHRFTLLNNGICNFRFTKPEKLYTQTELLSESAIILQAIYGGLKNTNSVFVSLGL